MEWNVNDFARDLSLLNQRIEHYEVPLDKKGLYDLEGKLQMADSLDFTIKDLEFSLIEAMAGTIPNGVKMFSIFLTHNCCLDTTKDFQTQDPFLNGTGYSFVIDIVGFREDRSDECYSTIRLDRHIAGGNTPKVCHPFYHIQFGGDSVASKQTGELLLTSSPRIAHPPLDLFLGIHFILDNFFNKTSHPEVKGLFEDYDYQSIMIRAQKRLWEPYFQAFSQTTAHQDYIIENIFPLYTLSR